MLFKKDYDDANIKSDGRRKLTGMALAVLLVTSMFTLTAFVTMPAASATFPGTNGRIVFTSDRDGNSEIYVMNDDGGGQTRITNYPGPDSQPRWSPDGTKIAFTRDNQIFVMSADGSGQINLSNSNSTDTSPSWSPDGTKIAFDSNRAGGPNIWVMSADGTGQKKLIDDGFGPSWSPNGSKIAFLSTISSATSSRIIVMNADGSLPTRINYNEAGTCISKGDEHWLDWSPDGTKLTFTGNCAGPNIYTINSDGTGLLRLVGQWDLNSSWSPDGTKIAFTAGNGPDTEPTYEIYLMNAADGSGTIRLTSNDARDGWPDWGVAPNIPIPPQTSLTVKSVDSSGGSLTGMWTTIRTSNGTLVKSGFTPLTFSGSTGTVYTVSVANYDGRLFARWQDNGSTINSRSVMLSSNSTLIAVYNVNDALRGFTSLTYTGTAEQPDLTVNALSIDANKTLHMWTIIDPQSTTNSSGTTATTYKVYASNYLDRVFDHWGDNGSRDRIRTITIGEATTITAYYKTA